MGYPRPGAVRGASPCLPLVEDIEDAVAAYEAFDRREAGWMKVELAPA